MEDLLALLDDNTVGKEHLAAKLLVNIRHFLVIDGNAALMNQTTSFALGRRQAALDQEVHNADLAAAKVIIGQLSGRHVYLITTTAKESASSILRFVSLFLTVDHVGQFPSKDLLGAIEVASLPLVHLNDLLNRQEDGQDRR